MITKDEVERLIDEDITFLKIATAFYQGHIDYMRWFEPEYNEDFTADFVFPNVFSMHLLIRRCKYSE